MKEDEEYSIPIETALSSLEKYLIDEGKIQTKGGLLNYVDNYFSVSCLGTKSDNTEDQLIYAVNFKEDSGYALLSADTRIPEDIIAITESGNVSGLDFNPSLFIGESSDNDDLSESEYREMVESGVLATQQQIINLECLAYANEQLATVKYGDVKKIGSPCDPSGPGGGYLPSKETWEWKTVNRVPRMLSTVWTQSTYYHDVFDKYCPEVGLNKRIKAPVGCVCTAVSQIVAHHEYPPLTCNEMLLDYGLMKTVMPFEYPYYYGDSVAREMVARFSSCIGRLCKIQHFSFRGVAYGFAWPWNAEDCLTSLGYKNVKLHWGYSESDVIQSIDNDCPVFISSISGAIQGHAWVIDGYIKRQYVSNKGNVSKEQTLVHCNWGWGGDCNGYFTSGVFENRNAVISDDLGNNQTPLKFQYKTSIITYDSPLQ